MLFALYKINFFITLFKKICTCQKKSSIFAPDLEKKHSTQHFTYSRLDIVHKREHAAKIIHFFEINKYLTI